MNYIHKCEYELPFDMYGDAINICVEDEKEELWVSNGEYASQVNFCPFCGYKAKIQLKLKREDII